VTEPGVGYRMSRPTASAPSRTSGPASTYAVPSTSIRLMRVSRHIAAIALFGVQLLQGVLPAAGAVCERQAAAAPTPALVSAEQPPAATGSHHHHEAAAPHESAPAEHPQAPTACPMSMACTVVGVVSSAIVVSTIDVAIDVHRPIHVADWPMSLDLAPEPPPPRG